jgi:hypothetical protein
MDRDDLLVRAKKAAKLNDLAAAKKYCDEHISQFPLDKKGLRLLAFVCSLSHQYGQALEKISEVISLSGNNAEPADYFNRGRWLLAISDFSGGAADFAKVIQLCEFYKDNYYLEDAYLCRAIAFSKANLVKEALEDLCHVGDDYKTFVIGKLYSKAELSAYLRRSK